MRNAYVVPGDAPIDGATLKRLVLMFDHVLIASAQDKAVVNEGEVTENFLGMTAKWSARGHYSRVPDFEERHSRCLRGAEAALNRNIVREVKSNSVGVVDAGTHWLLHNAALSDVELLRAATEDASASRPEIIIPNTILQGAEIAPSGLRSKYSIDYRAPASIPGIHDDWNWIGHMRVGRAIKSLRIAQAVDAAPIATDAPNSKIVLELARRTFPSALGHQAAIDLAIGMDVVDNEKLERSLEDVPWADVLRLRKQILPAVLRCHEFIGSRFQQIPAADSIEASRAVVRQARSELGGLREQEAEAWEKLRIGAVLKSGGVVGGIGLGSIAIPSFSTLATTLIALGSAGLLGMAAISDEMQNLIPARKRVRQHPLFFAEKLGGL